MSPVPNQYRHDEPAIMRSPVGQRALLAGVADSLLSWCRKNSRNNLEHGVVDRLIRTKAENDALEADIRRYPAKYLAAGGLLGIRDAMRERERVLKAKYLAGASEAA